MINEDNPYQGYANYESPRRSYSAEDLGYPERKGGLLRNPILATATLLLGASLLAVVILVATPSDNEPEILPIIKADARPMKVDPKDRGGMEIPNRDSTVFDQMRSQTVQNDNAPQVENLLVGSAATVPSAQQQNQPQQAAQFIKPEPALDAAPSSSAAEPSSAPAKPKIIIQPAQTTAPELTKNLAKAQDIVKKLTTAEVKTPAPDRLAAVPAPKATPPSNFTKPNKLHPAGSSPETLAFVRSVLKSDDLNTNNNKAATKTKTTAKQQPQPLTKTPTVKGAPKAAPQTNTSGAPLTHFVQLSSVKSESGATQEWGNLTKRYGGILSGSKYRVQKKDLGAKGIYYRVQAGPFTKSVASAKCASIKAITPQGCYLVAK